MDGRCCEKREKATDNYIEYWPLYLDTYANLLYKVAEKQEDLKWQELAVAKSKELKIGKGDTIAKTDVSKRASSVQLFGQHF